ncbi:inactive rhomboid protein 1-like isoform X1 [Stylophora pistillata]|uniref:Inactive rhomboid protein 1 n=1 Tax=Stylophora pistillata TaxID=50429 RepID=A0A2B4SPG5_STYPI|nr:inactive rhomboid protein 1-like isoform X1 [Stylophora pistillata]PFX30963.1 Inactive rhomboid protein 1 [Stylophora pistillata]
MADAYQPTTVQRQDSEGNERTAFCNPFQGRRHFDLENGHEHERENKDDSEGTKHDRGNQGLLTRCVTRQTSKTEDGSALPSPAESELFLPATAESASNPSKLTRVKTLKKKIIKGTENFFGLGDCDEDHDHLQRKWNQRTKRHYHKRYGALIEKPEDVVDSFPHGSLRVPGGRESLSSYQGTLKPDPDLLRTLSRRESVATMAWKRMKKMKEDTGSFKSPSRKSQPVSTLLEAGRSFSPAVMSQSEMDEVDSGVPVTRFDRPSIDDEVFFDFSPERPRRRIERPGFLPEIQEERPAIPTTEAKDEVEGPPMPPVRSTRGQRIRDRPCATNANRRELGKGMVGRWLNRTIKRKRLTSTVKKQIENLSDHRPYFTYWISFVQVIVLVVGLAVYGFAPIGFTETKEERLIDRSQMGTLVPEYVARYIPDNFWIGPDQAGLIKMGAKFAPCMRSDKRLQEVLLMEKRNESQAGCCVKSDDSGCITTTEEKCSRTFAYFWKYSKSNNKTRVVCGQDPDTCLDPPSVIPDEWDKDITNWPICREAKPNLSPADYPHMTCDIHGRPCCMGNEAICRIVSRDECDFFRGRFHENLTLCSQVDCLRDTCGMLNFHRKETPDQVYRLWMAMFAHAGVIHLACTLAFHITIMRDMEKMAGWLRLSIIYIFSGIGGYLYSAILLPYQAEVGPSGSIFGIIACLFVELLQSWQIIARPFTALFKLCGLVFLLLIIGLLPYVDNFAHMIGFLFGLLLAFIFLPYVSFNKFDRKRKQIQIIVCFVLVIMLFVIGFLVFYVGQDSGCNACGYLNCIPFTKDFCKLGGQNLQPRAR